MSVPVLTFSKQTSKAASPSAVNTILFSPARSLGRPYSFPRVSLIYHAHPVSSMVPPPAPSGRQRQTYLHVDGLPVALAPTDSGRDDNQRVLAHKVPHAPLPHVLAPLRGEVEPQALREGGQEEEAAEEPQQR